MDCEYFNTRFPTQYFAVGKIIFGQGTNATARFQASAAVQLKSVWDVTWSRLLVGYRRFGTAYQPDLRGRIDRLSPYFCIYQPIPCNIQEEKIPQTDFVVGSGFLRFTLPAPSTWRLEAACFS